MNTPDKEQPGRSEGIALVPAVNVHEDAGGITLYADLPGVPRESLVVEVEGETLRIAGDLALQLPDGLQPTYAEVAQPRYRRVFTLSKELDRDAVEASLSQGVLTVRIPKAAHAQPRRIDVHVT
jgi:HSP20 family molecular chaperone IbpA